MIAETKLIKKLGDFMSRLFQNKKEKKEQEALLLKEAYDLLKELEQTLDAPSAERVDLVDYTNLLLQKAQEIRTRKNRAIVRHIRRFAERNCLAGVIPDSEMERVDKETKELLELLTPSL
jgi:Na+/phosphate symporter